MIPNDLQALWDAASPIVTKQQNENDANTFDTEFSDFYDSIFDRPEPPPTPDQEAVRRLADWFFRMLKPHYQ